MPNPKKILPPNKWLEIPLGILGLILTVTAILLPWLVVGSGLMSLLYVFLGLAGCSAAGFGFISRISGHFYNISIGILGLLIFIADMFTMILKITAPANVNGRGAIVLGLPALTGILMIIPFINDFIDPWLKKRKHRWNARKKKKK
ncbi:hypothetical protein EFE32_07205 [Lactococcus lactis subsp. lactis]|uniref:hypothetical protein n=1 Tax=Lactococcus lactis TaxID=1358 RepID=UPI00223B24A0|nr:hypothetical protein [Lactococcus lactis]MCT0016630.1 hypothetical protein [Lactococcus lactis subsp. lactis]